MPLSRPIRVYVDIGIASVVAHEGTIKLVRTYDVAYASTVIV